MSPNPVTDLGGYLKEQREQAELSLRQLAERSGISNPYLSQIERGLKKPSAEILQALAKGLRISAEQLYVRAGILDATVDGEIVPDTRRVINADPLLTAKQRKVLIDLYDSYIED
ncbi:helix-turn-helix transcriptional regulator [Calidifontibacter sp. DB0510]|uniref:Helix-turn-helix transcriptional regulator n=1 Tax=Metallococcus carri TaxID=1656884 RepID=A0A967B006_9MICO|nr:helix-turn-helix transcriptional regulator [Metallococcus carri]NHN55509.1 helix-turn-helix transcriptional regulator [Metallococcus carri]NOP38307.1 helix-turn-helix transcriptional regulator [Calidifontibacter sp. DB2511S]